MSRSKENNLYNHQSHFVRYLYQEGQRTGAHKSPDFYQKIIKFVNSPDGEEAFNKFIAINPRRFGITTLHISTLPKKVFA